MRLLTVFAVLTGLAACGDPLAGLDRLADVDGMQIDAAQAALPDETELAREGFLGTSAVQGDVPDAVVSDVVAQTPVAETPVAETPAAGGFFRGLIRRAANADPAAAIAADVARAQSRTVAPTPDTSFDTDAEPTVLAALAPEAEVARQEGKPVRGLGLFGGRVKPAQADKARTGPDARDVPFGITLAFGEIARVCEARGKSLGQKVDGSGRRGFTLYDSNPGVRDRRTFYITGFADDCPRQFTAANALFGTPSFYELIRFSPAGKHLPFAATDKAYDKVKSSICRAAKTKPCGTKIGTLDGNTAFVSAYEFHEHNGQWKEFLIHDGTVLAGAVKSIN